MTGVGEAPRGGRLIIATQRCSKIEDRAQLFSRRKMKKRVTLVFDTGNNKTYNSFQCSPKAVLSRLLVIGDYRQAEYNCQTFCPGGRLFR